MTTPQITPTPEPSPEAIKASFGFVGALANAIPELKAVLDQAVREQWTNDRFIMAMSASNWYRTNSDKLREWITLQTVDPATAQSNHIRAAGEAWTFGWQNGIRLSDQQASEAALWRMFNPNSSEEMFRVHLARNYFNPNQDWNQLSGNAAALANQIQEVGRAYGWDDFANYDASRNWLGKLMRGEDTIDGFKRAMLDIAKVKYPGLHDQLLGGMTLKEIAQPYLATYSQILEVPETGINWYEDKLVQEALQYRPYGGSGGTGVESNGAMPVYQFQQKLRQDPRWKMTNNAIDSTADVLTKIGKDWGFIGE